MDFDPKYQEGKNGPLSKHLRDRIAKFRSLYTLAEIGRALSFSGAFISQILNEKTPARVDSKHIPRIVKALEEAEATDGNRLGLDGHNSAPKAAPQEENTLEFHMRAIDRLGWKILGIAPK